MLEFAGFVEFGAAGGDAALIALLLICEFLFVGEGALQKFLRVGQRRVGSRNRCIKPENLLLDDC